MAKLKFVVLFLLACCAVTSCSKGGEEVTSEKGAIEKLTDATADRVVTGINSSLDAARKAADQANAEIKQQEKMLPDN